MQVPFQFSFASANQECALWQGRVTSAGAQLNALAPTRPLEPTNGRVYRLLGFCLMTDTAGAPVEIGVWNITDDTFVARYLVMATDVEAGGVMVPIDDGILLDCTEAAGDTLVPAVRYIGAATAKITGHLTLGLPGMTGEEVLQAWGTAYAASVSGFILQENSWPLEDEVPAPLQMES